MGAMKTGWVLRFALPKAFTTEDTEVTEALSKILLLMEWITMHSNSLSALSKTSVTSVSSVVKAFDVKKRRAIGPPFEFQGREANYPSW
jgi:hypothetical protein